MTNAVAKRDEATVNSLAVQFADQAIETQRAQRLALKKFVKGELKINSDFGNIPGCPKPCLFKPGAEKLANLFQLGMRIVNESRDIDISKNWAMFTYRIELVHLPSGKVVSQCEGSANSQERKYKSRPAADNINTLQKMAQKRAYVGAVIIACGASDFFTQDVEDMDLRQPRVHADASREPGDEPEVISEPDADAGDYVFGFGIHRGKRIKDVPTQDLEGWINFWAPKVKTLRGAMLEAYQCAKIYLAEQDEALGKIPY